MHKQFIIVIFVLSLLFSCHNNSAKQNKLIVNNSTVQTSKAALINSQSNSFTAAKMYLDSLFKVKKDSANFTEQTSYEDSNGITINSVLVIGNLFKPTVKSAIVIYRCDDSTLNCRVFTNKENIWLKIFDVNIPSELLQMDDIVDVEDINGDKIPDLIVTNYWSTAAVHGAAIADAWLFDGNSFTKIDSFENIYNAEYDSATNEVYSYISAGCGDMSKYFGEYKIIKNKAVLLKEISCDCCPPNDSCNISVSNKKPFSVKYHDAYKYAPGFYKAMYKQELDE